MRQVRVPRPTHTDSPSQRGKGQGEVTRWGRYKAEVRRIFWKAAIVCLRPEQPGVSRWSHTLVQSPAGRSELGTPAGRGRKTAQRRRHVHWGWRMSRSGLGRETNSQGGGHTLALGGLRQLCLHGCVAMAGRFPSPRSSPEPAVLAGAEGSVLLRPLLSGYRVSPSSASQNLEPASHLPPSQACRRLNRCGTRRPQGGMCPGLVEVPLLPRSKP